MRGPNSIPKKLRVNFTALVFLLIGTVGGAVGGNAVGIWMGRHLRTASSPRPLPVAPAVAAGGTVPIAAAPPLLAPPAARTLADGGAPAAGALAARKICVEVRDTGDRPVLGALINARKVAAVAPASSPAVSNLPPSNLPAGSSAVGELGVYAVSLPYPEDIIAGKYSPLYRVAAASGIAIDRAGAVGPRTDENGRACLSVDGPGHFVVSAVREDRSASAELVLPESQSANGVAAELVLRLMEPLDTLCRLSMPPALPDDEDAAQASSPSGAGDVTGRVVDGRGFGLAMVRLEAEAKSGRSRVVGVSDGRGNFRLAGLVGGAFSLRAQLSGYAPLVLNRRADEPRGELQLSLRPGGGIAGTLRDGRQGNLPQGAKLVLYPSGDATPIPISLSSDGSFSATGLPVGAATLRARAPGYAPLYHALQIPVSEVPDQASVRDLRLDLEPGGGLAGQASGSTGAAAGVAISVYDGEGNVVGRATTDDHGEFRLTDLPAGRLRVSASAPEGQGDTTVDIRSGDEERIHLELR
jgi:hypothetical protein